MKIALIRKEFDPRRGGAERYSVNLARGLAAAGHDVHVFAGAWAGEASPGITLHRVPFVRRPSALKNSSFQNNSRRLVARQSFDIVHGLSQVYPGDVYRMAEPLHAHRLHLRSPGTLSQWLLRLSPRHRTILELERRIFATGAYRRYIAISELCRRQITHYYGVADEAIRVIYNGVDHAFFNAAPHERLRREFRSRHSIAEADTVLLFAGNDFKRKGLIYALECAGALKKSGVKLCVTGRGSPRAYERAIHKMGLEKSVLFLGSLPDIRPAYHGADLLLHPALDEPFGNVCLEAMACGLPVATTPRTGASEIIEDSVSGIITDVPGDILAMSEKISRAISKKALPGMGEMAARAARTYTLERNVQKTLALYHEIQSGKGMPA